MASRTLTITQRADWEAAMLQAAQIDPDGGYQGEILNFESTARLFKDLTERRWRLITALQEAGRTLGLRELARRVGRDASRVSADVAVLVELGLVERTERGGVICPYDDIHLDIHARRMRHQAA